MKVNLELNITQDGRKFLNYWDLMGMDICCKIIDGKLFEIEYDNEGKEVLKEISFPKFVELIELAIDKQ